MIKNGSKLYPAALILCVTIVMTFFVMRICGVSDLVRSTEFFVPVDNPLNLCSLDLNTATWEELSEIPGVGTSLAKAIITYREKYGDYVDTDELMNIYGMSKDLYRAITQYVYVGGAS